MSDPRTDYRGYPLIWDDAEGHWTCPHLALAAVKLRDLRRAVDSLLAHAQSGVALSAIWLSEPLPTLVRVVQHLPATSVLGDRVRCLGARTSEDRDVLRILSLDDLAPDTNAAREAIARFVQAKGRVDDAVRAKMKARAEIPKLSPEMVSHLQPPEHLQPPQE